jgi:hypothetical protein
VLEKVFTSDFRIKFIEIARAFGAEVTHQRFNHPIKTTIVFSKCIMAGVFKHDFGSTLHAILLRTDFVF